MGPIHGLALGNFPEIFLVMVLGAATFSALGLFIGCAISPAQIGLMFSSIIGPMIFFGCTYYPWAALSRVPAMKYAVLINPLVYISEGFRAAFDLSLGRRMIWGWSTRAWGGFSTQWPGSGSQIGRASCRERV